MFAMTRMLGFVALALLFAAESFAQVPPGLPYDATKHPNVIVTWVTNSDFKTAAYADARDAADIELMALSQTEGKRESIQMAETSLKKVRIGVRDADVTFYPVVRQTFRLTDGAPFVLHSFKFPKVPLPPQLAERVLNEAAFLKTKKPEDARFGLSQPPEMFDIRGYDALMFDRGGELTVFWVEDGVGHTATAKLPQKELFRLIEDLL